MTGLDVGLATGDFSSTYGPYIALALGAWSCRGLWERWRDRRWERRHTAVAAETDPDQRPGTDQNALRTCQAIARAGTANRRNTRKEQQ